VQLTRVLFLCGLLTLARPAAAFKESGHRSIEAAAYRELFKTERGRRVIRTLITHGALKPPAHPSGASGPHDHFYTHTVNGLVMHTHFPDHSFERQFQSARQCFHFNASGSHVTNVHGSIGGVPRGLVEHAYLDCVGIADGVLRGILADPEGSHDRHTDLYALMHMLEDSFSEAHVARDEKFNIVYIKPWTLRTWARYFFAAPPGQENNPIRLHFTNLQHYFVDHRDWGYLLGQQCPSDTGTDACEENFAKRKDLCEKRASAMLERTVTLDDLKAEVLVPTECLSGRALRASAAVKDVLILVADHIEKVQSTGSQVRTASGLDAAWKEYRMKYLLHVNRRLTAEMRLSDDPWNGPDYRDEFADAHDDLVWSDARLAPRKFRTAGVGITTQLDAETPVWVGMDSFVFRDTLSSHSINFGLDALAWGVQIRLPLENSVGERPVGIAFDLGLGFPINVAQLADIDTAFTMYAGLRARFAYDAQAVFEGQPRHMASYGFGGFSMDFVIANRVWFGFDAPRKMYTHDFWLGEGEWQDSVWSFSGGVATDAF